MAVVPGGALVHALKSAACPASNHTSYRVRPCCTQDELARKRIEVEHEKQRARQVELVQLQVGAAVALELAREALHQQVAGASTATRRAAVPAHASGPATTAYASGPATCVCSAPPSFFRPTDQTLTASTGAD